MNITQHFCSRRLMLSIAATVSICGYLPGVQAESLESPERLIERVTLDILNALLVDQALIQGDLATINNLVDKQLMPHVNFTRMTASSVGRFWRQANTEQRQQLQQAFKTMLVRTYAGTLQQLSNQTFVLRPSRFLPTDNEVVIRTELRGRGDPIQIDYRMERTSSGWKVYDLNVFGIWLVETYRTQFAQEINARGIDGLIQTLNERNAR